MKRIFKKVISSVLAFAITVTAVAELPGNGIMAKQSIAVTAAAETADVPEGYTAITNMEELYAIRSNPSGKYILMNDIDMSETAKGGKWDCGTGWAPIPTFSGTFDGNGHKLMNMHIFGSVSDKAGFIAVLSSKGTVKNVRFSGVDVDVSTDYYGTVAAYVSGSEIKITDCHVDGNISVKNTSSSSYVGGIVGRLSYDSSDGSEISMCSTEGSIGTTATYTGGICGYSYNGTWDTSYKSFINQCYNNANITGTGKSGGIIAFITGSKHQYSQYGTAHAYSYITDCYNAGKIKTTNNSGGIVGEIREYVCIQSCMNYSDGKIVGSNGSGTVTNCYYSSECTFGDSSYGKSLTPSLIQQQASYAGFDFNSVWYMCPEHNRPELQAVSETRNIDIESISFASLPKKLVYYQGDELDISGAVLTVTDKDSTQIKANLFKNMLSGYDMSKIGKQTVTVTISGVTTSFQITVLPIEVTDITLSNDELTINKGESAVLTATVSPDNATDKTVTWTSDDESVATVDSEGKVTAVSVGSCNVTATAGEKSAKCKITVMSPASEITVSEKTVSLHSGDTKQLTTVLAPDDCTDTVSWNSSNEETATVDENGLVTALKPGKAVITAAATSGVIDTCMVTVDAPAKNISFENEEVSINIGETLKLKAIVDPEFTTDTISWSSSNSDICIVDEDGNITGFGKGSAVITATATSGTKGSCTVNVNSPALSITLNKTETKIEYGESETLTAELFPTDSNDTVTWTSSDTSVCIVNDNGTVRAVKPGKATITATTGSGKKATCDVTVVVSATSITLSKTDVTIRSGDSESISYTLNPSASTDKVTWSTSDSSVAYVSSNYSGYNIEAVGHGTATITATTDSGVTATCKVTVYVNASSVSLKQDNITLNKGKTAQLKLVPYPDYAIASIYSCYVTSGSDVVSVTEDGVITALNPGTAEIMVSTRTNVLYCTVTVKSPATAIKLNKTAVTVAKGSTYSLSKTLTPSDSTDSVSYTSSNKAVATVSSKGVITAVAKGTAVITATTTSGKTATCTVTVSVPSTSLTLNKSSVSVYTGKTYSLKATMNPADTTDKVTWISSNTKIATISASGVVTAKAQGTATITAKTTSGKSAVCTVKVLTPATSVKLIKTAISVNKGKTYTLKAMLSPSSSNDTVKWTSSNTKVATVSSSGVVKGIAKGTATITVTTGSGKKATCMVTVKVPSASVKLNKTVITINKGKTYTLKATMSPVNTTDTVKWTSSNTKIATVSASGVVKGIAKGTATITATTTSGKKATCKVTVNVPATSVKLSKTSVSVVKGKTYTLKATLGPVGSNDTVKWTSSNTKVATVSASGVVKGIAKGVATITVTTGSGKKATCKVTVKVPSTSVKLNKTAITINKGKTYTLKATMSPANTTDAVKWTSSNTKIATVSASGVVKGIAKGTATITATTTSGKKATCKVTVNVPATSVKLSKTSVSVVKGKTYTLKATLGPVGSNDTVKWTSSNTKVATVSASGVVKGIAKGVATITVTTGSGKKATCKVTVKEIKAKGIKLNKTSATVSKGKTLTLKATLNPSNTTDKVTWKSSNTKVATVSASGVVKGVKHGTCTITATINGKKATCKITVPKIKTTKISLNKTSANINTGKSVTLNCTINPANSDEGCKWSVSDSSIATISTNGKKCTVKGKKAGTVTVTVTSGSKKATCKVKVTKVTEQPDIYVIMNDDTDYKMASAFTIVNRKSKTLTVYSDGARLIDNDYSSFNRNLSMVDPDEVTNNRRIVYLSQASMNGNAMTLFLFDSDTKTWYDEKSTIKFYFSYDGVKYVCYASAYYGTQVYKA